MKSYLVLLPTLYYYKQLINTPMRKCFYLSGPTLYHIPYNSLRAICFDPIEHSEEQYVMFTDILCVPLHVGGHFENGRHFENGHYDFSKIIFLSITLVILNVGK